MEHDGNVKAQVVPNTQAAQIIPFVENTVASDATIHTDKYPVYNSLERRGYDHKQIAHNEGKFVNGNTVLKAFGRRTRMQKDITPMFWTFWVRAGRNLQD